MANQVLHVLGEQVGDDQEAEAARTEDCGQSGILEPRLEREPLGRNGKRQAAIRPFRILFRQAGVLPAPEP